ncbi:MAG: hypothetical protein H6563_11230 [Lewinellaceae bacterium]|nr:hypothetical protein [Lewinellaceae bacterium]
MRSSKLIALLHTLQPDEWHWLAKWVRSPYYNNNEGVISLFDHLRKFAPELDSPKLEKETVFSHLFPGQAYDDQRLRLLLFRLSELVEGFLVAQRLKRDRLTHQQFLQAELGARNQYPLFEKENRDLGRHLEQYPYRDEDYYLARWRQQYDYFFHPQTARYAFPSAQLEEMMQNLDAFFILSKMRYSAELRNRQNILPEQHDIALLVESRKLVAEHPVFSIDMIFQTYRDMLDLIEQPDNEHIFLRLEEIAFQHLHLFRSKDQSTLLRYLINTTIYLYNEGKQEYLARQLRLYQLGLAKDLFLDEGQLSDGTFLNIVITATILGELDWVEGFLATYAALLPFERQADAGSLGTAYWYFAKGDFSACHDLLRKVENTNLQYLLRVKSLSLRTYFELFLLNDSYYNLVVYESKAFEKFLHRNEKITEQRAQGYLNLVYYLRQLAMLKTSFQLTSLKLGKLRNKLEKEGSVIAKPWLLEKLAELTPPPNSVSRP